MEIRREIRERKERGGRKKGVYEVVDMKGWEMEANLNEGHRWRY